MAEISPRSTEETGTKGPIRCSWIFGHMQSTRSPSLRSVLSNRNLHRGHGLVYMWGDPVDPEWFAWHMHVKPSRSLANESYQRSTRPEARRLQFGNDIHQICRGENPIPGGTSLSGQVSDQGQPESVRALLDHGRSYTSLYWLAIIKISSVQWARARGPGDWPGQYRCVAVGFSQARIPL